MASGCSSGETLSEPEPAAGDLANAISQGTVTEEMLERCAQEGRIDVRNKEGQTPLMLACLKGLEDVVKFLLANGADPNSKSSKDGNTPLHYACMLLFEESEDTLSVMPSDKKRLLEQQKLRNPKLSIVKLLLKYRASVQNNIDGCSPVYVAAFYLLNDCVEFLLMSDDDIPLEDEIKAYALLGVLQANLGQLPVIHDAFYSFCRAINLQEGAGVSEGKVQTSELAAYFSEISLKEFHKLEKSSESKELFPRKISSLKYSYFFPSLAYFAFLVMFNEEKVKRCFQVFSHVLASERCGRALLQTVVRQLGYAHDDCAHKWVARHMLSTHVTIFKNVHSACLLGVSDCLRYCFGTQLYDEIGTSVDILKSSLRDKETLMSIIQSRILRERPDEYNKLPSLTCEMMFALMIDRQDIFDCKGSVSKQWFLVTLRYLLLRLLLSDNGSYHNDSANTGDTLLHMLASCICFPLTYRGSVREVMRYIQDLAQAFIRHGCSLDAVNQEGETARDILHNLELNLKKPHFEQVESFFSPPTTVLRLEEAAVRVVLRHKINYVDVLPLRLHKLVDVHVVTDLDFPVRLLEMIDGMSPEDIHRTEMKDLYPDLDSGFNVLGELYNFSSEENSDSNDSSDSSEENSESGDRSS